MLRRWFAAWICFALLLSACRPQTAIPQGAATPLKVLAVETFLADIAQNVAGDRLKIEALMPLGVDPHSFEPTPQDVARVAESDVLIVNGAGFEEFLTRAGECGWKTADDRGLGGIDQPESRGRRSARPRSRRRSPLLAEPDQRHPLCRKHPRRVEPGRSCREGHLRPQRAGLYCPIESIWMRWIADQVAQIPPNNGCW